MDRSNPSGGIESLDNILAHYGVKGMKWGVRRSKEERAAAKPYIKKRSEDRTVKLKNGDTITLRGNRTSVIGKVSARLSPGIREQVNNSYSFTIKDAKGKSVGGLNLYRESPTSLNLAFVGTKTSQRGKGYATAAVRSVLDMAKENGLKKVTLEVPDSSKDARHIYEKMGFKAVKAPKDYDPENSMWGPLTWMEREIKHSDANFAHYGIKGMKWGVRRSREQLRSARKDKPPASEDAVTAKALKKKAKAGGLKALSNDELKTYLERMDLEKRYKKGDTGPKSEARKFVKDTLLNVGKQEASKLVSKEIAKLLANR